jgi:hypothetical protein
LGAFREKAGLRQSVEECRRIGALAMKHTPVLSGKAVADWRLSIDKPIAVALPSRINQLLLNVPDYRLSAFGGRTLVGCVGAPRCFLGPEGRGRAAQMLATVSSSGRCFCGNISGDSSLLLVCARTYEVSHVIPDCRIGIG